MQILFKALSRFKSYARMAFIVLVLGIGLSCAAQPVPTYAFKVVNTFPHDTGAFTQGLIYEGGILYEGTGLYGESSIREVDLATGKVTQVYNLPAQYYGEGITMFKDRIIQLTLESNKGFVYDKDSFRLLQEFSYPTQGWGITHDGSRLIMSDGTSTLYMVDPVSFQVAGRIEVSDRGVPVSLINELEYVDGKIYANIWRTDNIAVIDPQSGHVTAWIDLSGLLNKDDYGSHTDVLNGIAYDAGSGRLFVTGKLWPKLFEIKIVPR
jgi:glutaminyl-peptide cyclotransferase